jgi:hypothetical protein
MRRAIPYLELEDLVRHDPAGRGVAQFRWGGRPLGGGGLQQAAESLARNAALVGIVTGFCVPEGDRWTVETDGPPGALYLARALHAAGVPVVLIADPLVLPALRAGCAYWKLPGSCLVEFPWEDADPAKRCGNEPHQTLHTAAWVAQFFDDPRYARLTHLVAVERVGPSFTLEALRTQLQAVGVQSPSQQARERSQSQPAAVRVGAEAGGGVETRHGTLAAADELVDEFSRAVPAEHRNACHNMRGEIIDAYTAKTHLLFEAAGRRRHLTTIGIGDGGNEIGMGSIPWWVLRQSIAQGPSARVACRIATQHLIVAGVSNWGAYALALAVAALRGVRRAMSPGDPDDVHSLLHVLVEQAGCVDGVTRRREPTVDGLPSRVYLQVLEEMRGLLTSSLR